MRAIVVMPPTREGPTRTYAGCTCSISVNEALEIDLPVRDGPAGPDDGGTVYCDFSMLPDELGQRAARALMSMAAALRGDDSEYPWSEPDPVGVGIALQAMSCLPDRNTIGKRPVYRIAFSEISKDSGKTEGRAPVQDESVLAARAPRETGMTEETVYLTPQQAARILGLSEKTLARYRVKAKGPVFVKLEGRVRYLRKDLDEWVIGRRRASTMDDGTVLTGTGQREAGRESATRRAWRSSRPPR